MDETSGFDQQAEVISLAARLETELRSFLVPGVRHLLEVEVHWREIKGALMPRDDFIAVHFGAVPTTDGLVHFSVAYPTRTGPAGREFGPLVRGKASIEDAPREIREVVSRCIDSHAYSRVLGHYSDRND